MAYRQKINRTDIRTISLKDMPAKSAETPAASESAQESGAAVLRHPGADVRRIAIAVLPLIVLLLVASYLDLTRHWVVPLAEWLMRLGS